MPTATTDTDRPVVLITGAGGNIGAALAGALGDRYRVVGMDLDGDCGAIEGIAVDLTKDESVTAAFARLREAAGGRIASVVHLAAYFDFTGVDHPLYQKLNVGGTRRLLRALQAFDVEQFVYAGTMLVHAPCRPGERIDEGQPIAPKWAYPRSKAAAEAAIREEHGRIPYVLLHLAGIYDERTAVPTLAHQIARIYERDFESHFYSGDPLVGQSMLHKDDMADAFRRVVDRRPALPPDVTILIGEPDAVGYDALQDRLGRLIHGERAWTTATIPKPIAKAGAWAQHQIEPVVPDALDGGEVPFIRPFMIAMADDHYALDLTRANDLLGWTPRHRLADMLPAMVAALKDDPSGWYAANGISPPAWFEAADERHINPEDIRVRYDAQSAREHADGRWAHFANMALGTWLLTSPPIIGLDGHILAWSDCLAGIALIGFAALSLSRRLWAARWACAAVGGWVMAAPVLFWAPTAAAYLNDTLVGALAIGFAICVRPEPGVSPPAAVTGPTTPPGWDYNPSDWTQRLPIIVLALVGLYVSRYLAAYQLGHIDGVWDPFFAGGPAPSNGTEEIITSTVSEAWPVSDAAVGALTYLLEIVTGVVGSRRRWRTMPWLVVLFGFLIVPLGVVSIAFIIIQPVVIGTWCTLCLVGAAAMLVQIPYSIDELVATFQFLARRRAAGHALLRVLFAGDTDEGADDRPASEFAQPPRRFLAEALSGGVSLPWSLAAAAAIGVWLMFTRATLGTAGGMADVDHVVGSLVLTVVAVAAAEVTRPARYLIAPLGLVLVVSPFVFQPDATAAVLSALCGGALVALGLPRGRIRNRYGAWSRRLR
ncbi:MAG: vitamin K epoxide reductase family protein [Rhodospirillales bacterium]